MITLNFLWHQHQPDYRHPRDGSYILPWVRLHAVKGYYDLLTMLKQCNHLASTVNFSGILLEQLNDYAAGTAVDRFAELTSREAATLDPAERKFVLANFFAGNPRTLINPHPRYRELKARRDNLVQLAELDKAAEQFSNQDLTDLMVWFNLAWIGYTGQRRPDVMALVSRGRDFTTEHQREVLRIHAEIVKLILPGYQELAETTECEVSVTPYHHPILPLLIDLHGLGTHNDADPLPEFAHSDDAVEQVRRGMDWYQRSFGATPKGAWPAEGSVSDAALDIFAAAGLQWVATDQQNLPRENGRPLGHLQPRKWRSDTGGLHVFFRDTRLADNIGFEYASWQGAVAGKHLVEMARGAAEQSGLEHPVVTIALDGENPWEAYPDGGESFLQGLDRTVGEQADICCRTPSRIIQDGGLPVIGNVSAGSWIGGNFDIWSRHPETRLAWRRLAETRRALIDVASGPVLEHLLAAEGSDWFWWFGDDFSTEQGLQFDELFRSHLIAAYEAAGRAVPNALYAPIMADKRPESVEEVGGLIQPVLDGRVTNFYEWAGAVRLDSGYGRGSMARSSNGGFRELWYGFSATALYLRLGLQPDWLAATRAGHVTVKVHLVQGDNEAKLADKPCQPGEAANRDCECAVDRIVECRIEIDYAGMERDALAYLSVELRHDDGRVTTFPDSGRVPLWIIAKDYAVKHWSV